MNIYHWMNLEKPGPSSSKAIQSMAEDNWQYFGHDGLMKEESLKAQGRLHPVDPSLGYKFGASNNLAAMLAMRTSVPEISCFIKKEGSQHCVKSHTGRTMGCYPSHEGAAKRLAQVEYFKKRSKKRLEAIGMVPEPKFNNQLPKMAAFGMEERTFGEDNKPKIGKGVGGFGRAPGVSPL